MLLTCCATCAASPVGSLSASCKGARKTAHKAVSVSYGKTRSVISVIPRSPTQDMRTWGSQSQHPHPRYGRGGCVSCGPQVERRWSAGLPSHDSGCTPASASQQLLEKQGVCARVWVVRRCRVQLALEHTNHNCPSFWVHCKILPWHNPAAATLAKRLLMHLNTKTSVIRTTQGPSDHSYTAQWGALAFSNAFFAGSYSKMTILPESLPTTR